MQMGLAMKRRAKYVGGMCANALIFYRRANILDLSAPSLGASWFGDETSFSPQRQVGKLCCSSLETVDGSNVLKPWCQGE